jgi:hypothetical protein
LSITNGYLTAEEAREYVGQNDSRAIEILEDVVTASSRLVDRHCGRHFYQVTATARIFDSADGYSLTFGPFNDLVSVTTVKTDDNEDGSYETTRSASTYQLHPVGATTKAPAAWPYTSLHMLGGASLPVIGTTGRHGLIEITGTWGWPTAVPPEVKAATRIIVAEVFKLKDAPLGVAGFGEMGVSYVGRRMPARALDLLAPFRHPLNFGMA